MATLKDFFTNYAYSFREFWEELGLVNFVETGTGMGDTISYVWAQLTKEERLSGKLLSIEIHPILVKKAIDRLALEDVKCKIFCDNSTDGLKRICQEEIISPTLFFLDAHFPGADFHLNDYLFEKDELVRLPLEEELKTIVMYRSIKDDVFIIDDLRLYEEGNYDMGNWSKESGAVHTGTKFVYDLLEDTHCIIKDYRYGGLLIGVPLEHGKRYTERLGF